MTGADEGEVQNHNEATAALASNEATGNDVDQNVSNPLENEGVNTNPTVNMFEDPDPEPAEAEANP